MSLLSASNSSGRSFGRRPSPSPHQYVLPPTDVPLPIVDLSGMSDAEMRLEALMSNAQTTRFDLTSGPPLSFTLVRLGSDRHALVEFEPSHHQRRAVLECFFSGAGPLLRSPFAWQGAVPAAAGLSIRRLCAVGAGAVEAGRPKIEGRSRMVDTRICRHAGGSNLRLAGGLQVAGTPRRDLARRRGPLPGS